MHFPEGWAKEKSKKVLFLRINFITMLALKKVVGPALEEEAKERAIRRIADFATLRKAPMVRERILAPYNHEHFNWLAKNAMIYSYNF